MDFLKRMLFAAVCCVAAIACYSRGIPQGSVLFLVAGLGFEALFWFGLLGKRSEGSARDKSSLPEGQHLHNGRHNKN
jgi:hypothetical protein